MFEGAVQVVVTCQVQVVSSESQCSDLQWLVKLTSSSTNSLPVFFYSNLVTLAIG